MQPTPATSVVLPYFNAEKTLAAAIESCLAQSFTDLELILVDNNSSDSSSAIANSYASKDNRVVLAQEENQGVAYASNLGFQLARAPLVARMDADDQMLPERLKKQVLFLNSNPQIGLVGGQVIYQGNEEYIGFRHYVNWSNGLNSSEEILLNRFVELPIVNPTLMFRKSVFEQYGGYNHGDFPEDYEMILRWLDQGIRAEKLAEPVLEWRDHPGRLTRTNPRYAETAFFQIKAKYLAQWLKSEVFLKEIWIWGAGKLSRKRSNFLEEHEIKVSGYIDVKPRQLPLPCIDFREIPKPGHMFILSYVSNRGKREEVRQYLLQRGYVEGLDFLLAA